MGILLDRNSINSSTQNRKNVKCGEKNATRRMSHNRNVHRWCPKTNGSIFWNSICRGTHQQTKKASLLRQVL